MTRLAAFLLAAAFISGAAPQKKSADPETIKLVQFFLDIPTAELPAEGIEEFLAIDGAALPSRIRVAFFAKKLELHNLKHMDERQKKGSIRTYDGKCAPPPDSKEASLAVLRFGGFWDEITEEEEDYLLNKTSCTEQELLCEFSLQIALGKPRKKGGKPRRHYFLHPKDPLMAYVAEYRAGVPSNQTKFFGMGGSITCRR